MGIKSEILKKVKITFPADIEFSTGKKVGVTYFIPKPYLDLAKTGSGISEGTGVGRKLVFENVWHGRGPSDIQMFKRRLERWANMHFDTFITPEKMKQQIDEVTVFATMAYPWKSINSDECLTFSYVITWMLAMDNYFDGSKQEIVKSGSDSGADKKMETLLKVMETMFKPKGEETAAEGETDSDEGLDFKGMLDEGQNLQLLESIADLKSRIKAIHPTHSFDPIQAEILRIVQGFLWTAHVKKPEAVYNPGTYKAWRLLDYSGNVFTGFLAMILGVEPSSRDKKHVLVSRLLEIVGEIGYQANDLFGHRWDSEENGEGYLQYLVGRGMSREEGMKSLERTLQENVDDYLSLRGTVLEVFVEKKQVIKMVDMLDNWIFGNFVILATSPRYRMVGEAEIQFM